MAKTRKKAKSVHREPRTIPAKIRQRDRSQTKRHRDFIQFRATVRERQLHLKATASTKWLMYVAKGWVLVAAVVLIKLLPDWWSAFLAAYSAVATK